MEVKDLLKKNEFGLLTAFSKEEIQWLNDRINLRKDGKAGVECVVRGLNRDNDYFELKPEEIVRQLYAHQLIETYGYPKELLDFEVLTTFAGREKIREKRIDIAIYENSKKKKISAIIEVKRPNVTDENKIEGDESTTPKEQMASYCKQNQAQIGVITNGGSLLKFYKSPDFDNELSLSAFLRYGEDIEDWVNGQKFTLKQLMIYDRLNNETLKEVISDVEQRFGANDSSDKAFDELFKLIFTKLYDEKMSADDADEISNQMRYGGRSLKEIDDTGFRALEFRAKEHDNTNLIYDNISELFEKAKNKWTGVFPTNSKLEMQKATVKACVKELQNVKLFNSNLEVVDEAFEQLVNKGQKGDMGQYFTPRYVIDMCVKMLNPSPDEKMIDTAAGSCGFPMHTIFHSWNILNPNKDNLFTTAKRTQREEDYVKENVFGIDFSEKSVRVGRMLNIVAGDGHTNVIELNTLDYENWTKDYVKNEEWSDKYREGFDRLKKLSRNLKAKTDSKRFKEFDFDIVMANPPFAGDLTNKEQLRQYLLGRKNGVTKEKLQNKVGRDILFIERNIDFLKPGGRMAVVLPQGRFNNANEKYIRDYILERCRLLGVVGLHSHVFKPHTSTKTSVLFVQKWTDESCGYPNICPKPQADENGDVDYPIFFATMQEPTKDSSGDKIYVSENYLTWNQYEYETVRVITRKSDGVFLSEQEFDEEKNKKEFKKSHYKIQTENRVTKIEKTTNNGEKQFIRDLFIEEYGELNNHRYWQLENVEFIIKKNKKTDGKPEKLSIGEYLSLNTSEKKDYKKSPIFGKNNNKFISYDEYNQLSSEWKKFYKVTEEVIEYSERIRDTHGHIFVKHDLFNHDPLLENKNPHNIYSQDGIAEAFLEFAKKEGLSFVK
ncbi:N-6 DNA methylase [Streptococcus saliviloxodontae]|uniref:Type I restriction enzyme M protein n=1 Tax=Streptococcus saliviloxodontae TaxID=1349416 RepID=A0ABS2PJ53_9STRE|nr:N-6 DNA methylase [Streptococcus saliviloxodontae]MBM7635384.1 type I restriction enzyme M protein [Streptococcus saliviloxodontae]